MACRNENKKVLCRITMIDLPCNIIITTSLIPLSKQCAYCSYCEYGTYTLYTDPYMLPDKWGLVLLTDVFGLIIIFLCVDIKKILKFIIDSNFILCVKILSSIQKYNMYCDL